MVGRVTVDHDSDVPPYRQLAAILRAKIVNGELASRSPLPSITRLQQEHGLAKGTVRKAIQLLVDEGYVRIEPGWGTFVIPPEDRRRKEAPRQP
jgi:DNA-binding GntR family transcriptional regulator